MCVRVSIVYAPLFVALLYTISALRCAALAVIHTGIDALIMIMLI